MLGNWVLGEVLQKEDSEVEKDILVEELGAEKVALGGPAQDLMVLEVAVVLMFGKGIHQVGRLYRIGRTISLMSPTRTSTVLDKRAKERVRVGKAEEG